jgi:hypothetical protein
MFLIINTVEVEYIYIAFMSLFACLIYKPIVLVHLILLNIGV